MGVVRDPPSSRTSYLREDMPRRRWARVEVTIVEASRVQHDSRDHVAPPGRRAAAAGHASLSCVVGVRYYAEELGMKSH